MSSELKTQPNDPNQSQTAARFAKEAAASIFAKCFIRSPDNPISRYVRSIKKLVRQLNFQWAALLAALTVGSPPVTTNTTMASMAATTLAEGRSWLLQKMEKTNRLPELV
jgi:hypothetical protein